MKKLPLLFISLMFASSFVKAIDVTKIAPLTNQNEIASAIAIAKQLDLIMKNISSCVASGESHEQCLCKNEPHLKKQSTLIKSALKKHPNWLQQGWFKFQDTNGKNS